MVSLLGGVVVLALATLGLWAYRWTWDAQALLSPAGDTEAVFTLAAFAAGTVLTAAVLVITTAMQTGSRSSSKDRKRRR